MRPTAACPVCPNSGLQPDDLVCPACGTDLTVLRRVEELPSAILNDAVAARGTPRSLELLRSATAFPRTRERALLLTGKYLLEGGDVTSAARAWKGAAALGESAVPNACLAELERQRRRTALERRAGSVPCPNRSCHDFGRQGGGNIRLIRVYGGSNTPLWACRTCGCRFTPRRGTLAFRTRMRPRQVRALLDNLLNGSSVSETARAARCSPATVRRFSRRIRTMGPPAVVEIARMTRRSPAAVRRAWPLLSSSG